MENAGKKETIFRKSLMGFTFVYIDFVRRFTKYIYHQLKSIIMESSVENYNTKLDEVIRRLEHLETLLFMGEVFPDDEEKSVLTY